MNKSLFKFSQEDRDAFVAAISAAAFKKEIDTITKADEADTGTFKVIISTEDRDRQGEIVSLDGWDFSFYKMNPVVLWCHDYWSMPVATCLTVGVETIGNKRMLVATGKWAPTDEAQQLRKLYDGGFLTTTSVGFIPKEFDNDTGTITKQELLEFSFVPIPANPFAVSLDHAKSLGLNLGMLAKKGITFTLTADVKDAKADDGEGDDQLGDTCTLDDGTPGVLSADPKNPKGPLICVPDEAKSAKKKDDKNDDGDEDPEQNAGGAGDEGDYRLNESTAALMKALTNDLSDEHDRHVKVLRNAADKMEEQMGNLDEQQHGSKSAAETHQDAIDQFRTKMAGEHEKHIQMTKGIVKAHAKAMAQCMAEDESEKGITASQFEKLLKSITEAIAIRSSAGGEGKDGANAAADAGKSEEEIAAEAAAKGTPNNGSKRAGVPRLTISSWVGKSCAACNVLSKPACLSTIAVPRRTGTNKPIFLST